MDRKEIEVTFKTITPLWPGDAWGECNELKLTGIVGSLRWWFEALVRGMGYNACDYMGNNKCKVEKVGPEDVLKIHEKICPICYLFGTTGWKSRFFVEIESNDLQKPYNGKVKVKINGGNDWHYESGLMGSVTLRFSYEDMVIGENDGNFVKMSSVFSSVLKILLYLISEYGMLGARTSMGYGIVKSQIKNGDKNEDIQITEDDWENFETFLRLFKNQEIRDLPNLKDMFFVKFEVNSDISEIINNMKQFYAYQDGIVEGNVEKWKDDGWVITSPVVRKCLRCIFRGKYSEKVCEINRKCNRNYWWIKKQSYEKANKNYDSSKTIDYLNLSINDAKTIRHFLMGSTIEPEFSIIQVSHFYKNGNNLEFRIWGWLPDKWPIKGKVNDILQLLTSVFTETPWDGKLPSSIKNGICWKNNALQKLNYMDTINQLFIKRSKSDV